MTVRAVFYVLMAEDDGKLEPYLDVIDATVGTWAEDGGPAGKFAIRQDQDYTPDEAEAVRMSLRFKYALDHVLQGAEVKTVTPSARERFEETVNIVRRWFD